MRVFCRTPTSISAGAPFDFVGASSRERIFAPACSHASQVYVWAFSSQTTRVLCDEKSIDSMFEMHVLNIVLSRWVFSIAKKPSALS